MYLKLTLMAEKKIITKKSEDFFEKYLNNAAPTGYEWEGQKIWMDYLKPYVDTFITDNYGTAVGVINPDAKYKVVIEGHADEISWYVNYISDNGLIYVIRNGGSDHQIAPSKVVNIHTKNGIVKGVFGWPAIHTRNRAKEEAPKPDNITIDVGAKDKEEVEKMVNDAEQFAEEDKAKRENVEVKNQAETLIYSTEKSVSELGEKLPEEEKTKIEACREQLKKSLETDDIDAIKSDLEALTQASHKMAELLYSQQAEQQGDVSGNEDTPSSGEKSGKDDEDIVDADFEEVKK